MATNWSTVRLARVALALGSLAAAIGAHAQTPRDFAVPLTARVSKNPATITLEWDAAAARSISIHRREAGAPSWESAIAIDPGATSFIDASVAIGTAYEYRIVRQALVGATIVSAQGFLFSGIEIPLRDSRGRAILIVDRAHAEPLAAELARLERDLVGDGWSVVRRDVERTASVAEVRETIRREYGNDPAATRALLLIGRIPVPYSGNIAPDGHADHRGAWAADLVYADVDGAWTDEVDHAGSVGHSRNVRGDGRYDQSTIPGAVELEVGRIDLSGMTAFGASETELLRRYLDRNHAFRHARLAVASRGFVDDNFGIVNGEPFAANAWRTFGSLLGGASVTAADWLTSLREQTVLFAYGCGPGSYTSAGGIGTSADVGSTPHGAIFSMLFGSYFGDWDHDDAMLRAPLVNGALASAWVGRPSWYLHSMGIGETIGHGARMTQNNTGEYPTRHARSVHIALMGDPTLRMTPVQPPTGVTASRAKGGGVEIRWEGAPQPGATYNVYRIDRPDAPAERLNTEPITGTRFVAPRMTLASDAVYMVRAVVTTTTASGSYRNASQGIVAIESGPVTARELPGARVARNIRHPALR